MKKLFLIILCLFLFQVSVNAITQDEVIKKHLSNRKLEPIEGIWVYDAGGRIIAIYKSGSNYKRIVLYSSTVPVGSNDWYTFNKGSSKYFYGNAECTWGPPGNTNRYSGTCSVKNFLQSINTIKDVLSYPGDANILNNPYTSYLNRLWPENFSAHNAKYGSTNTKKAKGKLVPSSGTAFFITDKGHLITNNHVIEGCKDKSKIVYKDKEYPAELIAKDKLLDFALLKADISRNKFVVLSDDPPKKLQRIIAAGYPLGKYLSDDLKFTSGIISSLKGIDDDSTLIQIDAALNKGNSGGPIVNEETGELVAVAVAGLRKDKTEAVNFGIKTNSLKNFLDANQIKTTGGKMLFSFGNADVSNILEESTVYTFCK